MSGPLSGIRVVEMGSMLAAPLAAGILADQGAEVVKVESLDHPDLARYVGPRRNGVGALFHLANRGKRAVALDVRTTGGREALGRLVARSDVVIHNFRPGVPERMGIAYEDLVTLRPDLVYLSITGFGPTGPLSGLKVYDVLIQAVSGTAVTQGTDGRPDTVKNTICDKVAAWTGAQAVTAALLARERGAGGQQIHLSLLDAAISFLWIDAALSEVFLGDGVLGRSGFQRAGVTTHLDGWSASVPATDEEFHGFCLAYDCPDVADDPRFATYADRQVDPAYPAAYQRVTEAAARLTVSEALTRLGRAGVAAVAVVDPSAVARHPQVVANETFLALDDPAAGTLRHPRPPARFTVTEAADPGPSPLLGQHTAEILAELGYTTAQIEDITAS